MSADTTLSQQKVICRAPDCRFEVRDTDREELVRITQDHAIQKHQITLPAEKIQAAIQPIGETGSL